MRCWDITVKGSMRLMRSAALKSSHIRNVEIHRVFRAMLSPTDGHVCLMDLRSSAGAILRRVAWLLTSMASAGKKTNADTVSGSPAISTPTTAASVVDLLRSISASIVEQTRLCMHDAHCDGILAIG